MKSFRAIYSVGLAAFFLAAQASPGAVVLDYQFNTVGDTEGWAGTANVTGLAADGDSLNGTAGTGDPRLGNTSITGISTTENWDKIIFRVREFEPTEPSGFLTTYSNAGVLAQINGTVYSGATGIASGDDFFTVEIDISGEGTADINSIRFDPIGGGDAAGNTFEIDFIQFTNVPEPSVALLGALSGLALLRRRRS